MAKLASAGKVGCKRLLGFNSHSSPILTCIKLALLNEVKMKSITVSEKTYPIIANVDVFIAGGGPAGVGAALSASRDEARTMLVERLFCLGGMMTSGLMSKIAISPTNKGIAVELLQRLDHYQGTHFLDSRPEVPIDPELTKFMLDRMLVDEADIDLRFGTQVTDVIGEDRTINAVLIDSLDGVQAVVAKYFIDCTGDGQLAYKAGASYSVGSDAEGYRSSPTLMFRVANCDLEQLMAYMETHPQQFAPERHTYSHHRLTPKQNREKIAREKYAHFADFLRLINTRVAEYPGMFTEWEIEVLNQRGILFMNQPQPGHVLVNCTRIPYFRGDQAAELTQAMVTGRKQVECIFRFMKTFLPGFQQSFVVDSGSLLGIRESRRIHGDYIFTEQDVECLAKFPDVIVSNFGGVEIHSTSGTGTDIQELEQDQHYHVPYRSIIARDFDNLLMAGRCFSANHPGLSAARNIAYCMALGQAAGSAAAQLSGEKKTNARAIDIQKLQQKLQSVI